MVDSNVVEERPRDIRAVLPIQTIDILRGRIFGAVIDHLCDKNLPAVQKAVGVWPWHEDIPVPNRRSVTMFTNGTLNFTVKTSEGEIFFGLWMFPGEVRIGFRIPADLVDKVNNVVRLSLDGEITPCPRIVSMGATGTFYDWIFRDRFASIDIWERALSDDLAAAVIADSIRSITMHLYMSVINAVIEHGGLITNQTGALIARVSTVDVMIDFDCNELNASQALDDVSIKVVESFSQPGDRSIFIVRVDASGPMEFIDSALSNYSYGFTLKIMK